MERNKKRKKKVMERNKKRRKCNGKEKKERKEENNVELERFVFDMLLLELWYATTGTGKHGICRLFLFSSFLSQCKCPNTYG